MRRGAKPAAPAAAVRTEQFAVTRRAIVYEPIILDVAALRAALPIHDPGAAVLDDAAYQVKLLERDRDVDRAEQLTAANQKRRSADAVRVDAITETKTDGTIPIAIDFTVIATGRRYRFRQFTEWESLLDEIIALDPDGLPFEPATDCEEEPLGATYRGFVWNYGAHAPCYGVHPLTVGDLWPFMIEIVTAMGRSGD